MTRLVAGVFGVLVAATFGAFFAAQAIKRTPSVIQSLDINTNGHAPRVFSPNADGRRDRVRFALTLKRADRVTLSILDSKGDVVRTLVEDRPLRAYQRLGLPGIPWDGRNDEGHMLSDGRYRLRITLREQGRSVIDPRSFVKDTRPPRPLVTGIGPVKAFGPEILPEPGGAPAQIHFISALSNAVLHIFRTGPGSVREVRSVDLRPGQREFDWPGTNDAGHRVSPGVYLAVPEWRDAAGNIGYAVPMSADGLPILTHGRLPGHGGMMVRFLGAQPPMVAVKARERAQILVDSRQQRYSWDVRRVGAPRPRKRSSRPKTKPTVTFGAPGGVSGVYLFEARTRAHATRVPLIVQARRAVAGTPARPHGVLVVMPVITWQGRNAIDDDGDGAPNELDLGVAVRAYRIMGGDGLPEGFTQTEAPVLQWLSRTSRTYDINTDMGLLIGGGPQLAGHHGVLIAGDARWLPGKVRAALRAFARAGGTVVSLGTDSLRRTVALDPSHRRLVNPSPPRPADVFGAVLKPLVTRTTGLSISRDDPSVSLFLGSNGSFSDVPSWEETASVGPEANLLSSAVTTDPPANRTVIAAERFGKGLVIRPGFPDFAPRLTQSTPDPAVDALMARMWTLLSR